MCFVQRLSLMRKINDEDDGNGFVYFRLFYTGNIRDKLGQVFEKLVDQEIDLKGPEGSKNGTFRPNCFSS